MSHTIGGARGYRTCQWRRPDDDRGAIVRYSQMSDEQRQQLLDNPEHYPLRVSFLGKVGLLSFEEVELLRQHDVDFDVADRQVAAILEELLEKGEPPAPPRSLLLRLGASLTVGLVFLKQIMRSRHSESGRGR